MTKDRITVSLEPENVEYLRRNDINASGLVNELVDEHRNGGVGADYLRELREKQVRSELESLESQLETKERELAEIQKQRSEEQSNRQDAILERLHDLETVTIEVDESHVTVEGLAREHFNGDTEAALDAMRDVNADENIVPEEYL